MATKKLVFDPDRLVALDQKRRAAQALQREANEKYHEAREARQEARLRADRARSLAERGAAGDRSQADQQAAAAEAEIAKLTDRMAELQSELDAHGAAFGRASTLVRRCLSFAVAEGLDVPDALADEARRLAEKGSLQW